MREQEILFKAISTLEVVLPDRFTVRTRGGDAGGTPPLCLLDWDSTRLAENGANPYGETIRDSTGTAVGRELHRYHLMDLDVTIRTYDESERDLLLSDVMDAFLPYEYAPSDFHDDTMEWEVGSPSPRTNPVVEPDWYEGGLSIRFKYISRVEQYPETLTSIPESVDVYDNAEDFTFISESVDVDGE